MLLSDEAFVVLTNCYQLNYGGFHRSALSPCPIPNMQIGSDGCRLCFRP